MRSRALPLVIVLVLALGSGVGIGLLISDTSDDATRVTTTTSSTTTTTTPACAEDATTATKGVVGASGLATHLRSVEVSSTGGCDIVVLAFQARSDGALTLPSVEVAYRPGPVIAAPSGEPLGVPGTAFLFVRLFPASCHDLDAPGFPRTCVTPDPLTPAGASHVLQARVVEDFESQLTWVLGLDAERPFTLLTDPGRGTVTVIVS